MRRNSSRNFILVLEEVNTQAELCGVEPTPELTPVEDEALTVDIVKDEQAIEEISSCVDDCNNEVGNLLEQAEANSQVVEPKVEDVIQSEVALEKACYILGYPRDNKISLSTESAKSALQISTEGIKEFVAKIIKVIKDLIAKAVTFFKKLIIKLKLKIGGYAKKLDAYVEYFKSLDVKSLQITDEKAKDVSVKLNNLHLATVCLHMSNSYGEIKMPGVHVNSYVPNVLKEDPIKLFNRIIGEATKKELEGMRDRMFASFKKIYTFTVTADDIHLDDTLKKDYKKAELLGCAGKELIALCVDEKFNEIKIEPSIGFTEHNDSIVELKSGELEKIINDSKTVIGDYTKAVKNTDNVFKDIADMQKIISDGISKIEAECSKLEESGKNNKQESVKHLLHNLKTISVDYAAAAIKIHVSGIKEYIAINDTIFNALGVTVGKK